MNSSDYKNMTAIEMAQKVKSGEIKALDLTKEALNLAKTEGKELNAFITLCEEKALAQAEAIDNLDIKDSSEALRESKSLLGVPIAVKDNMVYQDYETTCGSHILKDFKPPYDSTCITNLLNHGAVIIGKTNMDEFAMGSSNENSYYGPVKNPLNHELVPGGSSGGSAAVVAQKIVPIAFGSETGGSVRQPASFCGIYGLKPTYGAISRYGLVAFGSSLDQISPFARNSEDITLAYQAASGRDPLDSTSVAFEHPDYHLEIESDKRFTIGVPKEYFAEGLDANIGKAIDDIMKKLESEGHSFKEISLPMSEKAIAIYYIISSAEASSNLARFDGVKYGLRESGDKDLLTMYGDTRAKGFGTEVKRRIMLGTYVLSSGYFDAYYVKASQVRELMTKEFEKAFEDVDLMIAPTTPTTAFKIGEKIDDPLAMYLSDIFTAPANLTGIPALSIPLNNIGETDLPAGVQFMAPHFNELSLFQISKQLENLK